MKQTHQTSIYRMIKNTNNDIKSDYLLLANLNEKKASAYFSAALSIALSAIGMVLLELEMYSAQMFLTPFALIFAFHFASYSLEIGKNFFRRSFSVELDIESERKHFAPLVEAIKDVSKREIEVELSIMKGVAKELKRKARALLVTGAPLVAVISFFLQVKQPKNVSEIFHTEINGASITVLSIAAGIYFISWVYGSYKLSKINYYINVLQYRLDWKSDKKDS
ncbi:hypothetical protein NBRC116583_02670 [Arenicella sp. 4NH20-0111]|uniref:hypothetical protein n=1 Tax=Arenicella sp. 4NH20-0111 TaxID=3127648 RepID=UPI00310AD099